MQLCSITYICVKVAHLKHHLTLLRSLDSLCKDSNSDFYMDIYIFNFHSCHGEITRISCPALFPSVEINFSIFKKKCLSPSTACFFLIVFVGTGDGLLAGDLFSYTGHLMVCAIFFLSKQTEMGQNEGVFRVCL